MLIRSGKLEKDEVFHLAGFGPRGSVAEARVRALDVARDGWQDLIRIVTRVEKQ
jgi:hypothetical protein